MWAWYGSCSVRIAVSIYQRFFLLDFKVERVKHQSFQTEVLYVRYTLIRKQRKSDQPPQTWKFHNYLNGDNLRYVFVSGEVKELFQKHIKSQAWCIAKLRLFTLDFWVMILTRALRLKQRLFSFAFANTFFNVWPQLDCYYRLTHHLRSESPPLLVKEPDIA